jgi:hypothetical protein
MRAPPISLEAPVIKRELVISDEGNFVDDDMSYNARLSERWNV